MKRIRLLDCTLRDGAYIVDGKFGERSIKGIIKRLQDAKVDIIECGWLKDIPHTFGSSFYYTPQDLKQYMQIEKSKYSTYVAMIDYNRYDINRLPVCDGETIDAIRIVFPKDKVAEGLALVKPIREKGYKVFLQAANTVGYSDQELLSMISAVNEEDADAISIVDTYGTMYGFDLQRILFLMNRNLRKDIAIGFHSHNNQQLSYALSMQFVENVIALSGRKCIVDSSLCGMGRGAGNTPTELIASYLNKQYYADYDINTIMDTIDIYMSHFLEKYKWGYSIPYMIAGTYECHVNNVAYLTKTHRTKSKDMKIIFEMLSADERRRYDYDNLEKVYAEYQNRNVDDAEVKDLLIKRMAGKTLVVILPGKSSETYKEKIKSYIKEKNAIVIGVNAIVADFEYDYLFFSNGIKYEFAKDANSAQYKKAKKIITSNVKDSVDAEEYIVNYNNIQKRKWKYYDNSVIMFLRLMSIILPNTIALAGFDGYADNNSEKYVEEILEPTITQEEMNIMQEEIADMFADYIKINGEKIKIEFLTPSIFQKGE